MALRSTPEPDKMCSEGPDDSEPGELSKDDLSDLGILDDTESKFFSIKLS